MVEKLTDDEQRLLRLIVGDKFSIGAFSGMIYNAKIAHPDASIEYLVKLALEVRLKLISLAE